MPDLPSRPAPPDPTTNDLMLLFTYCAVASGAGVLLAMVVRALVALL
ncbi:MAG TPA: hypothetical protein VGC57_15435 [Cellulomonas sp.]